MTGGPLAGPASAYPMLRTPALICFSGPKDVFPPAPVGAVPAPVAAGPAAGEQAATEATEADATVAAKARENALLLSTTRTVDIHQPCPRPSGDAVGVRHLASQCRGELGPGADGELGEDPVQVRAHRPVRQVQPLADLPVGQALGGQLGDAQLVRGELVAGVRAATGARLTGGAQFRSGPF